MSRHSLSAITFVDVSAAAGIGRRRPPIRYRQPTRAGTFKLRQPFAKVRINSPAQVIGRLLVRSCVSFGAPKDAAHVLCGISLPQPSPVTPVT
jgi:hypothetical protein